MSHYRFRLCAGILMICLFAGSVSACAPSQALTHNTPSETVSLPATPEPSQTPSELPEPTGPPPETSSTLPEPKPAESTDIVDFGQDGLDMQHAIRSWYTLIIDSFAILEVNHDLLCLDLKQTQMQNLLIHLENSILYFKTLAEVKSPVQFSWHKPLVEILDISQGDNRAEVLVSLELTNYYGDEALADFIYPGENRFTLLRDDDKWRVAAFDFSQAGEDQSTLPSDHLIERWTEETVLTMIQSKNQNG